MKKFYELPVVEITVFDVEDVITTSIVSTRNLEGDDLTAFTAGVEAQYGGDNGTVVTGDYNSNSYTW